jgi:preprotein translocase subunit YajC
VNDTWGSLIPLVLLLVFAYFVLIRPARRRANEIQSVQSALSAGDEVMLASGIYGTVLEVGDERLTLEVAPGVVLSVARAAVARIVRDIPADTGGPPAADAAQTMEPPVEPPDSDRSEPGTPDDGTSRGAH